MNHSAHIRPERLAVGRSRGHDSAWLITITVSECRLAQVGFKIQGQSCTWGHRGDPEVMRAVRWHGPAFPAGRTEHLPARPALWALRALHCTGGTWRAPGHCPHPLVPRRQDPPLAPKSDGPTQGRRWGPVSGWSDGPLEVRLSDVLPCLLPRHLGCVVTIGMDT